LLIAGSVERALYSDLDDHGAPTRPREILRGCGGCTGRESSVAGMEDSEKENEECRKQGMTKRMTKHKMSYRNSRPFLSKLPLFVWDLSFFRHSSFVISQRRSALSNHRLTESFVRPAIPWRAEPNRCRSDEPRPPGSIQGNRHAGLQAKIDAGNGLRATKAR